MTTSTEAVDSVGPTYVLRVFVDAEGGFGNSLAVILDSGDISTAAAQATAQQLGYSETVLVDDLSAAKVRIFSPTTELPFAGHPLVGVAWLLRHLNFDVSVLRPPAGDVAVWDDNGITWIRARADWSPDWEQVQLQSAGTVNALKRPQPRYDFTQFWAWADEVHGIVRARVFAGRIGTYEDEACGSASLLLAHRLARSIEIRHGEGSTVWARPGPAGSVEVGGRVVLDEIKVDQLMP